MRNSNGYSINLRSHFRKTVSFLLCLLFLVLLVNSPKEILSQSDNISSEAIVGYELLEDGSLVGSVVISLSNETENPIPIKYFTTSIPFRTTESLTAKYSNQFLDLSRNPRSNYTEVKIDLDNRILRENSPIGVIINFKVPDIYKPGLPIIEIPTEYSVNTISKTSLIFPSSLGEYQTIQPSDHTIEKLTGGDKFIFEELKGQNISILLNETYIYEFQQTHKLNNEDTVQKDYEIIIPPSSQSQDVIISSIDPQPTLSSIDSESNVIIHYNVPAQTSINVNIYGFIVKNIVNPESVSSIQNSKYTQRESYWDIEEKKAKDVMSIIKIDNDEQWHTIDQQKRDQLVSKINDHVVKVLDNNENDDSQLNVRLGATSLIEGYDQATPTDYVDLTIALLRLYNIPSRQVVGYSTNLQDQFKDQSTHTWTQYWEPSVGWRNFDTYLNELLKTSRIEVPDSDRVILMYRGLNPVQPQYTSFTLEDIKIELSEDTVTSITNFDLSFENIVWDIKKDDVEVPINISNKGSTIISSITISDGSGETIYDKEIVLVPSQNIDLILNIERAELLKLRSQNIENLPISVSVKTANGSTETSMNSIPVTFIQPNWWPYFLSTLSLISFLIIVVLLVEGINFIKSRKKKK